MKISVEKLAVSAMLVALVVSLSSFVISIGMSKCFPIQRLASVVTGVFLGPGYGVAMAFCTLLIRNLMGTGSLLAFPGSMIGALICGLAYRHSGKLILVYAGEVLGTGTVGSIPRYLVTIVVMGKGAAIFTYVMPFLMSTLCGIVTVAFSIRVLCKSGVFKYMKYLLDTDTQPSKTVGR